MSRRIKIDQLSGEIVKIMQDYAGDVTSNMKEDIDSVAKEAVKKIKSAAPVRDSNRDRKTRSGKKYPPGTYKKSWTSRTVEETFNRKKRTIDSKGQYQLTHLLEKGHKEVLPSGKTGRKVEPIVHIQPAEEWAVNELQKRTIRRISSGV